MPSYKRLLRRRYFRLFDLKQRNAHLTFNLTFKERTLENYRSYLAVESFSNEMLVRDEQIPFGGKTERTDPVMERLTTLACNILESLDFPSNLAGSQFNNQMKTLSWTPGIV